MKIKKLSYDLRKKLGYYVYLYINPLNGQVFYVGKGVNNRCLSHLSDTSESKKVQTIQDIRAKGLEPRIEILVHSLPDELSALKIEAAVIDLIGKDNLTNEVRGYETGVFGRTPLDELIAIFEAQPVEIEEPAILIRVTNTYRYGISTQELYDITRSAWVIGKRREKAQYGICVYAGIVREVYCIEKWLPAGSTPTTRPPEDVNRPDRWEFVGKVADESIRKKYLLKSVEMYFSKRSQNPITYINC